MGPAPCSACLRPPRTSKPPPAAPAMPCPRPDPCMPPAARPLCSMPKALTAYGGVDTLTHALESYVSIFATDFTKARWLAHAGRGPAGGGRHAALAGGSAATPHPLPTHPPLYAVHPLTCPRNTEPPTLHPSISYPPLLQGMSREATRLIMQYLPRAYANGSSDLEARERVHYAATIAGARGGVGGGGVGGARTEALCRALLGGGGGCNLRRRLRQAGPYCPSHSCSSPPSCHPSHRHGLCQRLPRHLPLHGAQGPLTPSHPPRHCAAARHRAAAPHGSILGPPQHPLGSACHPDQRRPRPPQPHLISARPAPALTLLQLGSRFHVAHGLANAALISHVLRYNATDRPYHQQAFPQYK